MKKIFSMTEYSHTRIYRLRRIVEGFIRIAEGVVMVTSLGFYKPEWALRYLINEIAECCE